MCKVGEQQAEILIYLKNVGEDMPSDWVCVDARIDDGETEDEDFEQMLNATLNVALSYAPSDQRNKASKQDNKFVKVRYAYVQGSRKKVRAIVVKNKDHFVPLWNQLTNYIAKKI